MTFQGLLAPLAIATAFCPTPLIMGSKAQMAFWGHLGPLQSMGPLGPFWLNSNEAKRGQGSDLPPPKARWAHLSQFWPPISTIPKMDKRTPGPKFASGNHQLKSRKISPQFRGRPLLHQCTPYQRIQVWCIYSIIYHYAPILLSNPMLMLSGPYYVFSIKVPKSITDFKGSLAIPGSYWKTIQGPQPPGPGGVGLYLLFRIILRVISRGYQ
ncbi:hypothetical protein O181_125097 [Austropuccinia psidii MF-1]|uniref:Uncharacterized protein n=1 Tax=Austropuccinia psidii MF-1 TaxID=1389203 RepID=A0A9Q3Q737_9BASI|nr:hypothetical protein [Austropuccinia psidii MF-1]